MSAEQDREAALSRASVLAGAVFLSYASEDASAAERIASALRAAGVEVWIDKSELRGGDAWDQSIRKQIKACALFIPIISRHAHDRIEGYFRLEWKLAVDRSHLIAPDQAFLLPVAIDDTPQSDERIPDRFRELQWTYLPAGEATPGFIERVRRLLLHEASSARVSLTSTAHASRELVAPRRSKAGLWVIGAVFAAALAYLAVDKLLVSRHFAPLAPPAAQTPAPASPTASAFNPPPHSVAVLPFVNMSGDKEQEYFSEGLTEELLNSLSRINELQVAARTSSFSFQGEHPDISTVAQKLNVGAVLEGSVRRSASTVRVTAQLINGVTGFHLWSQTYDRSLGDALQLQTDIATAVASALKVTLLGDEAAKIQVGGTRNPAAFDAYLRATKIYFSSETIKDAHAAIDGYTEAINLDPAFALAYAARSLASENLAEQWATTQPAIRAAIDKAEPDARKAIALAPNLVEGHLALAEVQRGRLEFAPANEQYERALALGPGNARLLRDYGLFAVLMGRNEFGLTLLRRAVVLDPLNVNSHSYLGLALMYARRYQESIAAFKDAQALDRPNVWSGYIGLDYYLAGDFESAKSMCENKVEGIEAGFNQYCLAIIYDKLGRHTDAERMLAMCRTTWGDLGTAAYAVVYAHWGNTGRALDLLETAMRAHLSDLIQLKHPLADPLRNEPRFQAVERELKFPD